MPWARIHVPRAWRTPAETIRVCLGLTALVKGFHSPSKVDTRWGRRRPDDEGVAYPRRHCMPLARCGTVRFQITPP